MWKRFPAHTLLEQQFYTRNCLLYTSYFHLPEYAIAKYWNDMSAAAPNTEFVIYNIPQLAGTALTLSLIHISLCAAYGE